MRHWIRRIKMLTSLNVKNLALIKAAELEFGPGLNILSGETGAGKSILLGSVSLCLGGRAEKELIRNGEDFAYTELVFEEDDEKVLSKLREKDIYPEDGRIIVSRRLSDGKSTAKINGETVTASVLKEVAALLIDIHGQHEHQSLLNEEKHLSILDGFARAAVEKEKAAYGDIYRKYRGLKEELTKFGGDDEERARKLDFLEFEIDEIEKASPVPGEEEKLLLELKRLSDSKIIRETLFGIEHILSAETSEGIGSALKSAAMLGTLDPSLKNIIAALNDIEALVRDTLKEVRTRAEYEEPDEERIDRIGERLTLIASLKKKYGGSEEAILKNLDKFREDYEALLDFDEHKEKIKEELEAAKKELIHAAKRLHEKRKEAAECFSENMREALLDLNFLQADFKAEVTETKRYTPEGADEVCFLISTNPGEPLKSLSKIASGGELSRIMLAIKNLIADFDGIHTLIFDEIDAGISGKTGAAVAEKLHAISESRQVICISHLPQIVAMADRHFLIEKGVTDGSTETKIRTLSETDSAKELARLLGTGELTEAALKNAYEMKQNLRKGQL